MFLFLLNKTLVPGCRDRRQAAEDEEYAAQVEEAQLYNNTGPGVSHPMPVMTGNQNAQTGAQTDVPQGQDRANMIRDLRQDGPDVQSTRNHAERYAN
ncbi:hypothetical protein D9613_001071 [Agrocybe pediades]|uniref:Uncharacterized protein n=1 Tax=Agrocybe pediades TaxID=84607 RepID=A0A8H4R0G3_9AGAR|nr:hypothetical protein D9613_001071 [Agrocybe pediades]